MKSPVSLTLPVGNSATPAATEELLLGVHGLRCAACVTRLELVLREDPALIDATVSLVTERARLLVRADPEVAARLGAAASAAGFRLVAPNDVDGDADMQVSASGQRDAWLLALSVVCALPLAAPMLTMLGHTPWHLSPWLEWALASPIQLLVAIPFYIGAYKAIRGGVPNMDVLVVAGTSAAYGYSVWLLYDLGDLAGGQLYFEASALIVTLVLLGKVMEGFARQRTAGALRALIRLRPAQARVSRDGVETQIAVADLSLGDEVVVKPGEYIAADGIVIAGLSDVDESMLTGEANLVSRGVGARVVGASLNGTGSLTLRVTALGVSSALGRIITLVEQAQTEQAPIQRLVDQVSARFVPAVLGIAAITFAAWMLTVGDVEQALMAAVAVLVIACPCALGLATPTAIVAGTGAAARHGILLKNVAAMERARALDTVLFDKTGTLTEGMPRITGIHCDAFINPNDLLILAASVESRSEHPLTRAFDAEVKARGLAIKAVAHGQAKPGRGVVASVAGDEVAIGNATLMQELEIALTSSDQWPDLAPGASRLYICRAGALLGAVDVADQVRAQARSALRKLSADRGLKLGVLSGDSPDVVSHVAANLNLDDAHGGMMPQHKLEHIRALRAHGQVVAFVGDGINDAPALAGADLGIAIGGASDVALANADISLLRNDLHLVAHAVEISQRTLAKITQNLFWACIYNVVCIPAAALGYLSPTLAGAAMAASSVSVVCNSLWLNRWSPEKPA